MIERARSADASRRLYVPATAPTHRLWAITSADDLGEIRAHLAPHQALIADGHHRYATYLQLRKRHRSTGDGPGPWDRGLALLIDQSQWPLQLGAIHRSISELTLDGPAGSRRFRDRTRSVMSRATSQRRRRRCHLVVTDGRRQVVVRLDGDRDDAVTDAEFLHERLLPAWSVSEDRLGYHHTVEQTVRNAGSRRRRGGVAAPHHGRGGDAGGQGRQDHATQVDVVRTQAPDGRRDAGIRRRDLTSRLT